MKHRRILLLGLALTLSLVIVPAASAHGGSHGSDHHDSNKGQRHVDQTPHGGTQATARLAAWNEARQGREGPRRWPPRRRERRTTTTASTTR